MSFLPRQSPLSIALAPVLRLPSFHPAAGAEEELLGWCAIRLRVRASLGCLAKRILLAGTAWAWTWERAWVWA